MKGDPNCARCWGTGYYKGYGAICGAGTRPKEKAPEAKASGGRAVGAGYHVTYEGGPWDGRREEWSLIQTSPDHPSMRVLDQLWPGGPNGERYVYDGRAYGYQEYKYRWRKP